MSKTACLAVVKTAPYHIKVKSELCCAMCKAKLSADGLFCFRDDELVLSACPASTSRRCYMYFMTKSFKIIDKKSLWKWQDDKLNEFDPMFYNFA